MGQCHADRQVRGALTRSAMAMSSTKRSRTPSMPSGGVIGGSLDQDVLAVGKGQRRPVIIDGVERERLHQRDRRDRLNDPLPECLAT